jgi:hypothetical protein
MVEILLHRTGAGHFQAVSDEDIKKSLKFKPGVLLRAEIKGSKKERSYRELKCYHGSCRYIADMNFNENMNTREKVDLITRIRCGFISDVINDSKLNQVHFIPKRLSYSNCDQQESHEFIAQALEKHSELVGLTTVEYVQLLNEQK